MSETMNSQSDMPFMSSMAKGCKNEPCDPQLKAMVIIVIVGFPTSFVLLFLGIIVENLPLFFVGVASLCATLVLPYALWLIWNCVRAKAKTEKKRQDLENANYLVGWKYEKQRWEEFTRQEYRRAVKGFNCGLACVTLFGM